jgi:hypothetical protein
MTQPAAVFLIGLIALFASGRTEAQTDLERAQNLTTCLGVGAIQYFARETG